MIEIYVTIPTGLLEQIEGAYESRILDGFEEGETCRINAEIALGGSWINRKLDTYIDPDILITRSIADIREPQTRESEYTKTIDLPGTKNNNIIFSHLFEVEQNISATTQFTPDFNPNLKANVIIYADGIEQMRGFLRLMNIKVDDSTHIQYQVTCHGQSADLFTTIADRKLNELDFSEYNHTLSSGNVIDSWATQIYKNGSPQAFAYGEGYVYAMFDKGVSNVINITDFPVIGMTPCLYAKTVVDKIFTDAAFTYTNDSYFNDAIFKRLILTPPNGLSLASSTIVNRQFQASRSTTAQTVQIGDTLIFQNDSTGGNFDNGNNYNPATGKYTAPISGDFVFGAELIAAFTPLGSNTTVTLEYGLYVNNRLKDVSFELIDFSAPSTHTSSIIFNDIIVKAQDTVEVRFKGLFDFDTQAYLTNAQFILALQINSYFYNDQNALTFGYGDAIDFGSFINSELKQSDMLMSFVKMFNLYIEPNITNPKQLRCVPRDNFYNGSQVNWTNKLDYSQPVDIVPMGDLEANPYVFTYKQGADKSNKEYQENYQSTYGSRTYTIDNDFVKTEKKIEIIFAPTQIKSYDNRQKNFVLSYIESEKDTDLRIFYYSGLQSGVSWKLYASPTAYSVRTSLPLTIHYDSLSNPTFDILFGMPKELGVGAGYKYGNSNLVNNFYYKFLTEITNKNSKILRAYFRITLKDYLNLSFADSYFFEGQYWRLNKIEDYNPNGDGVYMCEFLLQQFIVAATITNKTIGGATGGGQNEETLGDRYPSGRNQIRPGIRKVSVGTSESTGNGVFVGQGIVSSPTNTNNAGFGLTDVVFNTEINGSVALICDDFVVTASDTLYIGNYTMYPNFLSGGNVKTITTTTNATKDDFLFLCDTSAGSFTLNLPDPTGLSGKLYAIKKINAGHTLSIATTGTSKIDGVDDHNLTSHWASHIITTNGTDYFIL